MQFSTLVLPAPLGPTMATMLRRSTSQSSASIALMPRNERERPSRESKLGMPSEEPALAPLVGLDVAIALTEAQVELLHVLVAGDLVGAALQHHLPVVEDVGVVGDLERLDRVLLGQEDADAPFLTDPRDGLEEKLHEERGQPERRLVDQEHPRAREEGPADDEHLLLPP